MRWLSLVALLALPVAAVAEPTAGVRSVPGHHPGVVELDETVISGNQELPKVLYILPWQQPDGLPDLELDAEFTELSVFRRLYPPAHRRELEYYDNLNKMATEE